MNKRNPRLVPYNLLDEKTKKTNRETVCAAVRTLIGYGYNIEPPDQESSKFALLSTNRTAGIFNYFYVVQQDLLLKLVFPWVLEILENI